MSMPKAKFLYTAALGTFIALALLLAGCASNAEKSSDTASSESYNFIFVSPAIQNPYWQDCIEGIQEADQEFGTNTTIIGPDTLDNYVADLLDNMNKAIQDKPDGILAYAGLSDMAQLIDEAVDDGIPFVAVDSDNPDSQRSAYVGTNMYQMGLNMGREMVKCTGGHAKIGYISTNDAVGGESTAFEAFNDMIYDYDMEVVAHVFGASMIDTATEAAAQMLEEHPEITAIICTGGYNVTGAAAALQEKGLAGSVVLMGTDDIDENLEYVRQGAISALFAQSPYQMGYQGVKAMKELIDNGYLKKESIDTGTILITSQNVDTYKD